MERRNHMLAPTTTSDRETAASHDGVLGPPPARPEPLLMGLSAPPAYSTTAPTTLNSIKFPDVPNHELTGPLPPLSHRDDDVKLPSLSSLTSDIPMHSPPAHWNSRNALPPMYPVPPPLRLDSPTRMDLDTSSNSVVSAASPDRFLDGRASSVTLDDPDVRLAAEALGDLRADFVSSPPNRNSSLPLSPPTSHGFQTTVVQPGPSQPEPLLSLLTTSHPFLASTIEGATSAYGGAKNFSPRFRSGAEYVEGYLQPIANTVGSVGRVTGVEGGVRWFLRGGRALRNAPASDIETGSSSKKRRKADTEGEPISNKRFEGEGMTQMGVVASEATMQQGPLSPSSKTCSRRMSIASTDTLPAYDDARSPAYTETVENGSSPRPWQSRLIMSTSGLSVAMSEESLRSLKYCLRWLRWANNHIARVINALRSTLEQYDREGAVTNGEGSEKSPANGEAHSMQSRDELAARIHSLKNDVLKTLKDVIATVSKYAGGALPDNARTLVRRHLTSLPQRFYFVTRSEADSAKAEGKDQESLMRESAHRVLVLAQEGLDMVVQVSGVVDGTIVSAEEWCDRMGKRRREQEEEKTVLPQTESNGDVKMG